MSEDRLGVLAENNKQQMHLAMQKMQGNFRRTDQDFHGKVIQEKGIAGMRQSNMSGVMQLAKTRDSTK